MVYFNESARSERAVAVYRELPALRLTSLQAARLFGMPVVDCEAMLERLVGAGRLQRAADGRYVAAGTADGAAQPRWAV